MALDITIPLDFETEAHRGFAFVEFEELGDAAAAMDNMDEAELFGRTLKVNIARPIKVSGKSAQLRIFGGCARKSASCNRNYQRTSKENKT